VGGACGEGPELSPKWEPQLREMGYLFLHLSSINAINGLNLTRDQAFNLRSMARHIERVSRRTPSFRAPLDPELENVRRTWLQARDLLLDGRPVPAPLEKRVNDARLAEDAVIRRTIRPTPRAMDTRCSSCHMSPGREPGPPMTVTPGIQYVLSRSHAMGIYGSRALRRMAYYAKQIKNVLTEEQMAIVGSFTCCLVPPADLNRPGGTNPKDATERALDLLRQVRQCPENYWPVLRGGILAGVDRVTNALDPDAGEEGMAPVSREEAGKLLDRARSLGAPEFELEKADLAKAVQATILPAQGDSPFKAAYFLLLPGSAAAYTQYLDRLAKATKAAPPAK
jgi:hypothetical protein